MSRIMTKGVSVNTVRQNQQGMVAIVVTSVLMLVISLIVLGFTQSVRREQRQALDKQLSTQAFYAAESGVKLAQSQIAEQLKKGESIKKTSCNGPVAGVVDTTVDYYDNAGDYTVDNQTNSEVTCLLVKDELEYHEFQNIGQNSKVTKLTAKTGDITRIYLTWEASSNGSAAKDVAGCDGETDFPANAGAWVCKQPLLRADIVRLDATQSSVDLANRQMTVFLSPEAGATNAVTSINEPTISGGELGRIQAVNCNGSPLTDNKTCTAEIQVTGSQNYGVRMQTVYGAANVRVYAQTNLGSRAVLVGGQAVIDSTAKAVDVIRRIQVRVSPDSGAVDYAIVSGGLGLCKRYAISAGTVSWDGVAYPACNL